MWHGLVATASLSLQRTPTARFVLAATLLSAAVIMTTANLTVCTYNLVVIARKAAFPVTFRNNMYRHGGQARGRAGHRIHRREGSPRPLEPAGRLLPGTAPSTASQRTDLRTLLDNTLRGLNAASESGMANVRCRPGVRPSGQIVISTTWDGFMGHLLFCSPLGRFSKVCQCLTICRRKFRDA